MSGSTVWLLALAPAKRSAPYPVLYLLHGIGDDASTSNSNSGAPNVLDNLIAQGKAKPMPGCWPFWAKSGDGVGLSRPSWPERTKRRVQASAAVARVARCRRDPHWLWWLQCD